MSSQPPTSFFRVHYLHAFTQYTHEDGFHTRESYQYGRLAPAQWLNKQTIEDHISGAKSTDGLRTPFISLLDDFTRACNLAHRMKRKGYKNVYIARIEPGYLTAITIELHFEDRTILLHAWMAESGFVVFSTRAVRAILGVDESMGHASEWFAIECVPAECVGLVEDLAIWVPEAVVCRCRCRVCEGKAGVRTRGGVGEK
ncbi:hypothetical protein CC86DRAFT_437074 [Ophiobolus disseminans]|uniref:DUF7587 domain-containing protein n=1 Tax=Ophiobolus disseminans TaxID=1469910 RepID=A0A6A7A920_9PLEO|nr:hypothetical protein CC86DRAFT_437074 [Ophiobolus disseminans]